MLFNTFKIIMRPFQRSLGLLFLLEHHLTNCPRVSHGTHRSSDTNTMERDIASMSSIESLPPSLLTMIWTLVLLFGLKIHVEGTDKIPALIYRQI